MVSLKVIFKDKSFDDQRELSSKDFYKMMETSDVLPTSSQPSPSDFLTYFEKARANGDEIIAITISSKLSGTYQSALIAKDMCEGATIYVVDSEQTTIGQQALVRLAMALREEGYSAEAIVEALEKKKKKVIVTAVVANLDNLIRGGRLSKTAGFAGNLLKIKPLIALINGKLEVISKARGMNRAMRELVKEIDRFGGIDLSYPVYFGFTGVEDPLDPFIEIVKEAYPFKKSYRGRIGAVIGVHAGSGALAIAYFRP